MPDGDGGRDGDDGDGSSDRERSTVEVVVMVVSVLFTVSLFAFVGWQVVSGPTATEPRGTAVDTRTVANGSVVVTVELRNRQDIGLLSATVGADCSTPPPEVMFEYIPASSNRRGNLVCPPGSETPTVSVSSWVNA